MRRLVVSFLVLLVVLLGVGLGAVQLRHKAGLERTQEAFELVSGLGDQVLKVSIDLW